MKTKHLLAAVGLAITAVIIVQILSTKQKKQKKLVRIADEGYETAEDILYPVRSILRTRRAFF